MHIACSRRRYCCHKIIKLVFTENLHLRRYYKLHSLWAACASSARCRSSAGHHADCEEIFIFFSRGRGAAAPLAFECDEMVMPRASRGELLLRSPRDEPAESEGERDREREDSDNLMVLLSILSARFMGCLVHFFLFRLFSVPHSVFVRWFVDCNIL